MRIVFVTPGGLKWEAAPRMLPAGSQMAVVSGDPSKTGPFAVRFKFPAGYEVATHSHPTDEFLTVVSGKARLAFGKDADAASAQAFPVGAFMSLPAGASQCRIGVVVVASMTNVTP